MFFYLKTGLFSIVVLFCKSDIPLSLLIRETEQIIRIRYFRIRNYNFLSDKGTVVNRTLSSLHGGSLEITLSVLFMGKYTENV